MEAWDAHVYFNGEDPASVEQALTLRYDTCTTFTDITVNRPRFSFPTTTTTPHSHHPRPSTAPARGT